MPTTDQQRTEAKPNTLDTYDFLADPRALSLDERRAFADRLAAEQDSWLIRLGILAEGRKPDPDFPAFLLATPAFAGLAQAVGKAQHRAELQTGVADELDWFLERFANYLRTDEDEDVFTADRVGVLRGC